MYLHSTNKHIMRILVFAVFFSICSVFTLAETPYKPLTDYEIRTLIPSSTRFFAPLYGKWDASYDDEFWFDLTVPYSLPTLKPITYKRTIRIDNKLIQKLTWHLYFLGLDDQVEVYFNNQFVGRYLGGLTPFTVRIPGRIITNETNTVKLVILPATDYARQIREFNTYNKKAMTGIPREIFFIGTPHVWVSNIQYKTKINKDYSNASVNVKVNISSGELEKISRIIKSDSISPKAIDKGNLYVEASIRRKTTGEHAATASAQKLDIDNERTVTLDFAMNVNNPALWDLTNPELYEINVKVTKNGQTIDELSAPIAFRNFEVRNINGNYSFFLNDSLIDIKGVDYIEDYASTGQTLSTQRMERDLQLIKTLGANLICVKYSVPHPYFLSLCDKYGILVMVDLPVYNVPNTLLSSDEIIVRMKNLADRMINSYSSHPSLVGWGIMDGVQDNSPEATDFSKMLITEFKKNSTKMIYKILPADSKSASTEGYDFIIIRTERKSKTYDDIYRNLVRLKSLANTMPIIINFGIGVQPQNHSGFSDPLSVESQAFYISNTYRIVKQLGYSGTLYWSFNDYELNNPLLTLNNDDEYICTSGIVDRWRQERLSFLTLQTLFNNEKEPLLNAGSYTERTPVFFIVFGLILIGVIIFMIQRFRRFREYIYRS
ncbi:MAG: glycoside hydrolase family 2 TIM barrel-domain containing protein, partial [Bacteroidota bacterium]